MSLEGKFSWDFLKNVADALDSYRIRALIDAKQDILNASIYNETQYLNILFKMFDEEKLKYSLNSYLLRDKNKNFSSIKKFSQDNALDVKKTLSLLELLKAEGFLNIDVHYDNIKGEQENSQGYVFKDISIENNNADISELKSIYEPVKAIYDAKVCSGCGLCAGICPVNCLGVYNGFGKIDEDKCIRCGLCYFVCPRSYLPVDILNMTQENTYQIKKYSNIGHFLEVYSARTKIAEISSICQDGGVSSTILHYLFDEKKIDSALGAKMSNTLWRPEPLLIKNKEDVLLTAGTKYVNNPTLTLFNQLNGNLGKLAVVGTPCMMQALLKSKIYNIGIPSLENVEYNIGIFCMESFSYQSFLQICDTLQVKVDDVKKTDINKGKFFIYTQDGQEHNVPIKEITHLAREDCELCFDLTSESADVSIGSIGSPSGWNTVVLRTEKGKNLYNNLISSGLIESKPIDVVKPGLPLLLKIAGSKRSKCNKHISSKIQENKRFPLY
jgi:coenzyme F420 hydrogenase subunit beta